MCFCLRRLRCFVVHLERLVQWLEGVVTQFRTLSLYPNAASVCVVCGELVHHDGGPPPKEAKIPPRIKLLTRDHNSGCHVVMTHV